MKQLTQKLELMIYGYKPSEYMPIFYEGKLLNKSEFIKYKLGKAFMKFADRFDALEERSKQW